MKRLICYTLIVLVIASAASTAGWPSPQTSRGQAPATEPRTSPAWLAVEEKPDSRTLVWVLDGAGDLKGCSTALTQANSMSGNAMEVSVFPWSHGYRRLLMDQIDMGHARLQGAKLARAILERKAQEPGRRVVVIAHTRRLRRGAHGRRPLAD